MQIIPCDVPEDVFHCAQSVCWNPLFWLQKQEFKLSSSNLHRDLHSHYRRQTSTPPVFALVSELKLEHSHTIFPSFALAFRVSVTHLSYAFGDRISNLA
jgi:hypothetical protein